MWARHRKGRGARPLPRRPPPCPADPLRRPGGGGGRPRLRSGSRSPACARRGSGAGPLAHEPSSSPVFTFGHWFTRRRQDAAVLVKSALPLLSLEGRGGCKAASPAPALAAAAHSHASLVLPASSAEDALPPRRLTPSVLSPSLPSSAASRAREGCEGRLPVCCPGAVAAAQTRKQITPSRDSESLTTIPAPRPTAVLATLTGTRSSPGLRQAGERWLCPATVAGASGRESAGRREAAAPDHHRRLRFRTVPAGMGGGSGSGEGAGTGEGTRRRCRSRKFSITAVVPPPPSGANCPHFVWKTMMRPCCSFIRRMVKCTQEEKLLCF
ncbi:translation initiation factor IF-2-like [Corvus kubaryi]|uniref:translation initiation factor IF-2-like n=1 Tax=Corvus kubaryi TaxID=68294 RepID=UPI001C057E40|nr:translation initiation factor IF-2-like [Corvus kubaryi]